MSKMGRLLRASGQLEGIAIPTKIENGELYVLIGDVQLELSDYEVNFRAKLWDEKKSDENEE